MIGAVRLMGIDSRSCQSLPLQFDDATNRTIELIDVLWLDRNSIVAAFEIESTTSIYSGLLRMADLVAMRSRSASNERLGQVKDFVRYLKPDFLEELSEACDLEQE